MIDGPRLEPPSPKHSTSVTSAQLGGHAAPSGRHGTLTLLGQQCCPVPQMKASPMAVTQHVPSL
jgi:hypothetical protein